MTDEIGRLFGMEVRVASEQEWALLLAAARAGGAVEVGNTDRADHDLLINDAAKIVFCKNAEIMKTLLAAASDSAP